MNKPIGDVLAAAKLKDGAEVEIRFDKHHYRAYNIEEQQVGPARVALDGLLTEIGGVLVAVLGPGEPGKENIAGGRDKAVLGEGQGELGPATEGPDAGGSAAEAVGEQKPDEETGDPRSER